MSGRLPPGVTGQESYFEDHHPEGERETPPHPDPVEWRDDDPVDEAIDALERIDWRDVDGVSAVTAAVFTRKQRRGREGDHV